MALPNYGADDKSIALAAANVNQSLERLKSKDVNRAV
jgi:hypothetical protein